MPSRFQPVSALIEVEGEWEPPNPLILTAPGQYSPRISRTVLHETAHYWQYLSEGFLTLLAEEEWGRLVVFERTGAKCPPGPIRHEFLRPDPTLGISPQDLHEGVARWWEFMSQGPQRLIAEALADGRLREGAVQSSPSGKHTNSFDIVMELLGGIYGKVYLEVAEQYGPRITIAFFALCSHFALQTRHPAYFFNQFIQLAPNEIELPPAGFNLEMFLKNSFLKVRNLCLQIVRRAGEDKLLMGGAVIKSGLLLEHPVYRWSFHRLNYLAKILVDIKDFPEFASLFPNASDHSVGILMLDGLLACPIDPPNRGVLSAWLPPPCVRFSDGKTWDFRQICNRELVPQIKEKEWALTLERRRITESCIDIRERWAHFLHEYRGY